METPGQHGATSNGESLLNEVSVLAPELATGSGSARVGCWFAEVGDEVIAGTSLLELIVPGIRLEIDAPHSGRLSRIEHPAGSTIGSGAVLCRIFRENSAQPDSSDPS